MKSSKLTHLLTIVILTLITKSSFSTAQFGDILIFNGDTVTIFSNPLEDYFAEKKQRSINGKELKGMCSALWRGYVATWEIENDSLFLIRIQTNYCSDNPQDLDLISEFNNNKVFANWYTGEINSQLGSMLSYMHSGYGSVYEREQIFEIDKGTIISIKDNNYIEFADDKLYPGIDFLSDTIKRIIYNHIDTSYLDNILDEEICQIAIIFNKMGELERISAVLGKDDSPQLTPFILKTARAALEDFPKIMKVNHDRYSPPVIWVWFHAHCLKHPDDNEYGCEDYRKSIESNNQSKTKKKKISSDGNNLIYILIITIILLILIVILWINRNKRSHKT